MEKFKPSFEEIFYALVNIDNRQDWNEEILGKADQEDILEVRKVLEQGFPLNEAEIEIGELKERKI